MINLYYVGRFAIRQKRIDRLLELSKLLDAANCNHKFKVFSDVDFNSIEYKCFENNIRFNFLGFKEDWVNYVEEDSIMIFVSEYEGCPLSVLEAYKFNYRKLMILEMPGVDNYASKNCICNDVQEMASQIVNHVNFENSIDLSAYYDKSRFEKEVENFYKLI